MATIGEMLTELAGVKQDIKTSLTRKGQVVGNNFTTYAGAIDNIQNIQSGEAKQNKILIILTNNTSNIQEIYDPGCEVEGSIITSDLIVYIYKNNMIYKYTTVYSPGESGQPTTEIKYTYNNVEYNSLQDVLDVIYGVGNVIGTDLTGIELVNYVNTLANTYNLTVYEYNGDQTIENWTYGCEPEPEPEPEPTPEEPTV